MAGGHRKRVLSFGKAACFSLRIDQPSELHLFRTNSKACEATRSHQIRGLQTLAEVPGKPFQGDETHMPNLLKPMDMAQKWSELGQVGQPEVKGHQWTHGYRAEARRPPGFVPQASPSRDRGAPRPAGRSCERSQA